MNFYAPVDQALFFMSNRQPQSFEITVDVTAEDEFLDADGSMMQEDRIDNSMPAMDEMTAKLKSAVTKRKGRGFSNAENDQTRPISGRFDSLREESSGSAQRSIEGWVIFVTGLNEETAEDDVYDKFADFGPVKDVKLNLDHRTGYVKGYALVEFASYKEAKAAIDNLNNSAFLENTIQCDFAFVRHNTSNGGMNRARYDDHGGHETGRGSMHATRQGISQHGILSNFPY